MIFDTTRAALLALLALLAACGAHSWRWPDAEAAQSVRIDAKVGFVDGTDGDQGSSRRNNRQNVQADDVSFQQPTDTEGFYNRPPGAGRYPVRVEPARRDDRGLRINGRPAYNDNSHQNEKYQDGTLDSLQYCKCVSSPDCEVRTDYVNACGANQYLCCYKNPSNQNEHQSEYFNEVDDERPMLFPGQSNIAGPFPPPNFENNAIFPGNGQGAFQGQSGVLVGPSGPTGIIGPQRKPVLVGPDGPTGVIGPNKHRVAFPERPVLVGPSGPTGNIGPNNNRPILVGSDGPTGVKGPGNDRPVLVGPGGPTGVIGPANNKPVLVGPGGPTGIIGPANDNHNDNLLVRPLGSKNDIRQSESAQRGVLVGPGGPTGIIGPAFNLPSLFGSNGFGGGAFNRPVLVGPSGPTGVIGPRLVGPGGPTGIIGPDFNRQSRGRGILVGPGGPTGRIGPRNYFGCMHRKYNQTKSTNGSLSKPKNRTHCDCSSQSQV